MTYADTVLADTPLAYFPLTESGEAIGDTYADATGHGYDVHVQTGRLTHGPGPLPCTTAPVFPDFSVAPYDNADALLGSVTAGLPVDGQPYSLEGWLLPQVTGYAMQWVAYGPAGGIIFIGGDIDIEPADVDHLHLSNYAASNLARNSYPIDAGDGRWHHIVITDDAGGTVVFYVDGTAVQTFAVGSNNGLSFDAGNVLSIGDAGGHYGTLSPADDPYGGGIAQVAIYGHVLTAGRVAAHYAAALASVCPPDWVRLSHESGRGYWQSTGDVIEEWAAGVKRLALPFGQMSPPAEFVLGKDPSSGLPMWVDPPSAASSVPVSPVTVPSPTPPVVPPAPGDACIQTRCGAAVALQTKLVRDYDQWRQWINAAISFAVGGLIASVLAEIASLLAVAEVAAWVLQVFKGVSSIIRRATVLTLPSLIPNLTGAQVDQMLHEFFCQVQCASGVVAFGVADQQAVSVAILADSTTYPSDLMRELLGEIVYYDPIQDWQAAMSNAPVSDLCDGMTCP